MLATLRNPPYFDFTMHSEPGYYRGFFWFYFFNEHVLRFLNCGYPRDYNTVPRLWFWLFHLLWLFPWSAYLPAAGEAELPRARTAPAARACWRCAGPAFVLVFFTFSTTQEYYSMPCYPALALLLGCRDRRRTARGFAAACGGARWSPRWRRAAIGGILIAVRGAARAGRHLRRADAESGSLHAVARPHGRPDAGSRSPTCACRWRWPAWRS